MWNESIPRRRKRPRRKFLLVASSSTACTITSTSASPASWPTGSSASAPTLDPVEQSKGHVAATEIVPQGYRVLTEILESAVVQDKFSKGEMVWGHPLCHEHYRWIDFQNCCGLWFKTMDGFDDCFDENNIVGEEFDQHVLSNGRPMSYATCCVLDESHPSEDKNGRGKSYKLGALVYPPTAGQIFDGCEDPIWTNFLQELKLANGCLICVKSEIQLQEWFQSDMLESSYDYNQDGLQCRVGTVLIWYSFFMSLAQGSALYYELRDTAKHRVMHGIKDIVERGMTENMMWELAAITITAMWYNTEMDHISSRPALFTEGDDGDRLIIDLGMSGGMDALYYAQHGFTVLGVEANVNLVRDARKNLPRRDFPRLTIMHAAISETASNEKLPFYYNAEREDFSSLDRGHASEQATGVLADHQNYTEVRTVTCDGLIDWYGKPYFLKIDIEGVDTACIQQLRPETAPMYISTELPALVEGYKDDNKWREMYHDIGGLLELLEGLGYTRFKVAEKI